MNKTLVVLAAGMGSRYGGLKQLDSVGPSGETIIEYSLYDALKEGFDHVVFIIRESFLKDFKDKIASHIESFVSVSYVVQDLNKIPEGYTVPDNREKPWGTGHALFCAIGEIKNPFLIINGDDFYGSEAFAKVSDAIDKNRHKEFFGGMVSYDLENTLSDNGSVSRGICSIDESDQLTDVTENHGIIRESSGSTITSNSGNLSAKSKTSMNLWYFSTGIFSFTKEYFKQFLSEKIEQSDAEYYLPTIANNLVNEGILKIDVLSTGSKWYGVTYQNDKEPIIQAISNMVHKGLYPQTLWGDM